MCNRGTASAQLKRLGGLPKFGFIPAEAFTALVDTLAGYADDADHAKRAVDLMLARKSLPEAPQDIADALNEAKHHQREEEPTRATGGCGREYSGMTYLDYDPNSKSLAMILHQSRCENGWVRVTKWKEVPGMLDNDGLPLKQPYHFSGKCGCQR